MRLMRRMGGNGLRALLVLSALASSAAALQAPADLSTPAGARRAYAVAKRDGDAAAMRSLAVSDATWDKVIDADAAASRAFRTLRAAAVARWGERESAGFRPLNVEELPETSYEENGDRAALKYRSTHVQRFRKVGGSWRVDLLTPVSPLYLDDPELMAQSFRQSAAAGESVAADIAAGRFASAVAAREAYDVRLRQPAGDAGGPATAPTSRPTTGPATRRVSPGNWFG